jgi:hypothetical protein
MSRCFVSLGVVVVAVGVEMRRRMPRWPAGRLRRTGSSQRASPGADWPRSGPRKPVIVIVVVVVMVVAAVVVVGVAVVVGIGVVVVVVVVVIVVVVFIVVVEVGGRKRGEQLMTFA